MRPGLRLRTAALLALLGLAAASAASAASGPWVTLVDSAGGFRLTIQRSWYVVPNSAVGVESIVAQLQKEKQGGVAKVYLSILESSEISRFWFEAFDYSALAPIQPTVTLAIARTSKLYASAGELSAIAATFAQSYAAKPQTTIKVETVVTLPEGRAAFVEATQGFPGASSLLELYVIPHGTRLYELSFGTDESSSTDAETFAEIAQRFAFT